MAKSVKLPVFNKKVVWYHNGHTKEVYEQGKSYECAYDDADELIRVAEEEGWVGKSEAKNAGAAPNNKSAGK